MELPMLHGFNGFSERGVGLADMAYALRNGRKARDDAQIGYHAIEVIHGSMESQKTGKTYVMTSSFERPAPLAITVAPGSSSQEAVLDD
jgi:hypothetical protein